MDYQTQTTKSTLSSTTTATFSHFDTTDIKLDSTGHAYLPFHPSSFGFPFGPSSFGSTTMAAMTAMMANPVPVEFGRVGGGGGGKGVDRDEDRMMMDKLPTAFFDVDDSGLSPTSSSTRAHLMMNGTMLMEHVNPLALSLQQSRRPSEGGDQAAAAAGGGGMMQSRRGSSSSSSSSRSSSCSLEGGETSGSRVDSTAAAVLEGMRRTSEVEVEAALIPGDDEEQDEDVEVDEMRVVCDQVDEAVTQSTSRVRKRNVKDDVGGSKKKIATSKRKSTATTTIPTADTSNPCSTSTVLSHPDSAFSIPDPPRPFSFKDLGLSPPPPFLGDDGEGELGSSEGEEEDGVVGSTGKTGKTGQEGRVRGKRREMNRVAAKRHREKNKDRLKSLEKRKTWLDTALVEYEKSNKRLSETLDRLKRENGMLKGTQVEA